MTQFRSFEEDDNHQLERLVNGVVSLDDLDDIVVEMDETFADKDRLARALHALPERYEYAIRLRFGMNGRHSCAPMPTKDVADILGVTSTRVDQIVRKGVRMLRGVMIHRQLASPDELASYRAKRDQAERENVALREQSFAAQRARAAVCEQRPGAWHNVSARRVLETGNSNEVRLPSDARPASVRTVETRLNAGLSPAEIDRRMRAQCRRNLEALERSRSGVSVETPDSSSADCDAVDQRSKRSRVDSDKQEKHIGLSVRLVVLRLFEMAAFAMIAVPLIGFAIMIVATLSAQIHYETGRFFFYSGPVVIALVLILGFGAIASRSRDLYLDATRSVYPSGRIGAARI